jgi:osmotically-inducible protein OsmY
MKTDRELQSQVLSALEWEPVLDAAHIGVTVSNGVVTLQGGVVTFREKWEAERAARHVYGVRAVANDLQVNPDRVTARSDSAIAEAAANALSWDTAVPQQAVQVTVREGWLTLTGSVPWHFQRVAAERAVQHLFGMKGVANSILVVPHVNASDVKAKIESAFKRSAEIDSQHVKVEAMDDGVVLTGTVRSLSEREEAERAAWSAPGVKKVDDRLVVAP